MGQGRGEGEAEGTQALLLALFPHSSSLHTFMHAVVPDLQRIPESESQAQSSRIVRYICPAMGIERWDQKVRRVLGIEAGAEAED